MNILDFIIDKIDVLYIIMCNVLSWFVISTIQMWNPKKVKRLTKRIVAAICAACLGWVMYNYFSHDLEQILYGFFIQFLTWDYIFKGVIKKITKEITEKEP